MMFIGVLVGWLTTSESDKRNDMLCSQPPGDLANMDVDTAR
jgi:hypothetical protein